MTRLPHPVTGELFASPVAPGTGWPDDPATELTPVAHDGRDVTELAETAATLADLDARVSVCRACPRLVEWREDVARTKRASFSDQPYWGRPVAGFGSAAPELLIVGLAPAANGANRTGRNFTGDRSGDFLYDALFHAGYATQPTATAAGDGLTLVGARITPAVHCAPPANKPTAAEEATCARWLDRELDFCAQSLTGVLCLGALAWNAFRRAAVRAGWSLPTPVPAFGHAASYTALTPLGRAVRIAASYHVSQQNTFTGKLNPEMFQQVLAGFQQAEGKR